MLPYTQLANSPADCATLKCHKPYVDLSGLFLFVLDISNIQLQFNFLLYTFRMIT